MTTGVTGLNCMPTNSPAIDIIKNTKSKILLACYQYVLIKIFTLFMYSYYTIIIFLER